MKMKVTIEIITGAGLIERVIECDYYSMANNRYDFKIKHKPFECDCGCEHDTDESIGSYPQSAVIIKKIE